MALWTVQLGFAERDPLGITRLSRADQTALLRVQCVLTIAAAVCYVIAIWARPAVSWESPTFFRVARGFVGSVILIVVIGYSTVILLLAGT